MAVNQVSNVVLVTLYRTIFVGKCESMPLFNFYVLLIEYLLECLVAFFLRSYLMALSYEKKVVKQSNLVEKKECKK